MATHLIVFRSAANDVGRRFTEELPTEIYLRRMEAALEQYHDGHRVIITGVYRLPDPEPTQ